MRPIFLVIFFCFLNYGYSQVNPEGNPLVINFDATIYRASEQNWGVTMDNRGVVYIANHGGVLEYDGANWRLIKVDNNSNVRSLDADNSGRVYLGAVNEFGYLEPDELGQMSYVSLLNELDTTTYDFGEVWKVYAYDDKVHFSTRAGFFTYNVNEGSLDQFFYARDFRETIFPLWTFVIDGEIYIGTFIKGLMKYVDGEIISIPDGSFFSRKNIYSVIKYDDRHLLISTHESAVNYGVYLYDLHNDRVVKDAFPTKLKDLFSDNYALFSVVKLTNDMLAFATSKGVIITDIDGNVKHIINELTGLQDQTVYALFQNKNSPDAPLWMALDNGLSYANVFNPLMRFDEQSGLRGLINHIITFNNTLFVATTNGVYYQKKFQHKPSEFIQVEDIRVNAWSLDLWENPFSKKENLLVGTRGDLFIIDHNYRVSSITEQLEDVTHNAYGVKSSKKFPERIYLGLSAGIEYVEIVDGRWQRGIIDEEFGFEVRSIIEEDDGTIWFAIPYQGYGRIVFENIEAEISLFNSEQGLTENLNLLRLYNFQDKVIFATGEGIYRFDDKSEEFFKDERFPGNIDDETAGYFAMAKDPENNLWMTRYFGQQDIWIEKAMLNDDGKFEIIADKFNLIPSVWCDAIYVDNDNIAWFGSSNHLYSFNIEFPKNYDEPYPALIRSVNTIVGDSLLFAGTNFQLNDDGVRLSTFDQPASLRPVLKYQLNNLEIVFASPYFEGQDGIEYSYILEGFDDWSRWTTATQANYSYIPVGTYTFKVKARNIYGLESVPASFSFTVLPPWYRTIWAYISYGILALLVVYVIIILNTRRLKREKEILEGIVKERTAEVVKQKDELEIQRDKIAKQNESITNSIEYAKRIQTAALPPDEFIDRLIPDRFILFMPRDIVSGDFYWIGRLGGKVVVVAADCTGHGVPGGFMSMLGIAYLNQIVSSKDCIHAGHILDQLRDQVMKSLRQKDEASESRDGMDIALYIYDKENQVIDFAGANNPLFIIRDNELLETSGDKMPIGIHRRADRSFVNHTIEVKKGDVIYTFSDGYKDQFGGAEGRKFMNRNFKELLLNIHKKPMDEQRDILEKTIIDWTGDHDRIDDIIVMGVRVN